MTLSRSESSLIIVRYVRGFMNFRGYGGLSAKKPTEILTFRCYRRAHVAHYLNPKLCRPHLTFLKLSALHLITKNNLPTMSNFDVAVVGAGLGGVTLASVLQKRGVKVTVYERETSSISRNQGGTLDMHPHSGQRALELAGLMEEFLKIAHPEADEMKIIDQNGNVTYEESEEPKGGPQHGGRPGEQPPEGGLPGEGPPGRDRPEVDRGQLRQILLSTLQPGTVKWGHTLSSCKLVGDKVELQFSEPDFATSADILVGADGTWSRVRPVLSPAKPEYTGVTFVDIQLTDVDNKLPELAKLVGKGSLFALGNNKGLIAQRNSGNRVRIYVAFRAGISWAEESNIAELVKESKFSEVQEILLSRFSDWLPSVLKLISSCDIQTSTFAIRQLFSLPSTHSWTSNGRVTLIGDAAHVMVPFAGEGANLAMLDGAELAEAIANCKDVPSLKANVEAFEREMLGRSKNATEESLGNQNLFISENGAQAAAERMNFYMSQGPPPA